ncbi:DUF6261 family protein [Carboxylicivirga sp. M1479]|uniref:DUF6261 family protein n=1 Tax=Carboxylicivirga sp. M1479 TaxID=2594476 RepID=UPI0011787D9D|nr:DUF6261 family protein [Carboxylicivirga sp. M1479]TRX66548.1 hypothetical protein FNN09_12850 [Carboxylicivirga sp. M1479]
MEIVNLPRLRMKQLQTVGENSLRICEAIPEVKPATDKVKSLIGDFKLGMQKENVPAVTKVELDKLRDKYISGFRLEVKSETYFPHETDKAQLIDTLSVILAKYSDINRYSYNEQTAAVDNMLTEISKIDLQEGETLTIGRWLPLIKNANEDFKKANKAFIEGNAILATTSAASDLAPQLAESLHDLYTLMFAHAKIGTNENIVKAYREIEMLIKSVN